MERPRFEFIGFGSPAPPLDELVPSETILDELRSNGVEISENMVATLTNKIGIKVRWRSTCRTTDLALTAARMACIDAHHRDSAFTPLSLSSIICGTSSPGRYYPS